jgi:hypothetical protein
VLPTAAGNGIETDGATLEPAAEPEPEAAVAAALALAFGEPPWPAVAAAGLLFDVAGDVRDGVPQPASAMTAAPARTIRADLYLLMSMPRPAKIGDPWALRAISTP